MATRQGIAMEQQHIDQLRRRAAHYRQLARGPVPWAVAEQLDALADECEGEARQRLAECWQAA